MILICHHEVSPHFYNIEKVIKNSNYTYNNIYITIKKLPKMTETLFEKNLYDVNFVFLVRSMSHLLTWK